jgi:hypothetical protein
MRTYDLLADILMPVMFFSGRVQLTGMLSERERENLHRGTERNRSRKEGGQKGREVRSGRSIRIKHGERGV